jgi:hypothetical protein
MVEDDDLDAAVAEGILTQAQLNALRTFVSSRRASAERADDERFRFMRGFNDFFFAVGIVLFGAGITFFAGTSAFKNILAAAVIWALAEFLVRRMRLVLPGIPADSTELGRPLARYRGAAAPYAWIPNPTQSGPR